MKLPLLSRYFLLFLISTFSLSTQGQTFDPSFRRAEIYQGGSITSIIQQADGRRIIQGSFTRINGENAERLVRFNADGTLDKPFNTTVAPARNFQVVRQTAEGKLLLLNGAYTANGVTHRTIVRLNADGTLDTSFDAGAGASSGNSGVRAAALQTDGKCVLAGIFTSFNGVSCSTGLVRLLPNGAVDASFQPVVVFTQNQFGCLAVQPDGKILLGARATFLGPATDYLVRLNADGSRDASFQATITTKAAITELAVQADGKIIVGADNPVAFGGIKAPLVRLLPSGVQDNSFGAAMYSMGTIEASTSPGDGTIRPLADGSFFVAPFMNHSGLSNADRVVHLLPNGSRDANFQIGAGPDGVVQAMCAQADGRVLVGGDFDLFDNQRTSVALLQTNGTLDPSFAPVIQAPGAVTKIIRQPDGKLLLLGYFTEVNKVLTTNVARLFPNGEADPSFKSAVPAQWDTRTAVVQADGRVVLGNYTKEITLHSLPGLLRLNADGSLDPSLANPFSTLAVQYVRSLLPLPDGKILAGGNFIDTQNRRHLTRLNPDGTPDASFGDIQLNQPVTTVLRQVDGRIVFAGTTSLTQFNSLTIKGIGRAFPDGTPDPGFDTNNSVPDNNGISALAQQTSGALVLGVNYITASASSNYGPLRLTFTGPLDADFTQATLGRAGSTTSGVVVQPNDRILVNGLFYDVSSSNFRTLFRLLPNGQLDPSFDQNLFTNTEVYDVLVLPDGALLAGGNFTQVAGQEQLGLVKLLDANVLATKAPQASAQLAIYPNPARTTVRVQVANSTVAHTATLLDLAGKAVLTQVFEASATTLPMQHLPAGVYVLRVAGADGASTQRIIVE